MDLCFVNRCISASIFFLRTQLPTYHTQTLNMYTPRTLLLALAPCVFASPTMPSPRNSSEGCSAASLGGFKWTVGGFDYHASYIFSTPAHQNSWGYVDFNISNPAVPDAVASCSAQSDQLSDFFYGTQWYQCTFDGDDGRVPSATFTFNSPTGDLYINQTWVCDDKDPQYP